VEIVDIDVAAARPIPTGIAELDRVLGGGVVPGSTTLIGGEPGIGKSTLLLQALAAMARQGLRCVLVSAEESVHQVKARAARIGAIGPGLWLVGEAGLPSIGAALGCVAADIVVVDSIQTIWDPSIGSPPGSPGQVRACAHQLVEFAKSAGPAVVLVGHVTKDGGLAGPRELEHLVDTVLSFEGDRHQGLRLLRAVKHRFGPTGEVGLLEMSSTGLEGVEDPARLFLADRRIAGPGSVVFASMEGRRPLLVEVQALVVASAGPSRRSVSGFDAGRLGLLIAVLDRRAGIRLADHEVYVSTVGGVRLDDPAADLAVCLAVASAATNRPIDESLVSVGEVGLSGEIRQVTRMGSRLAESARLGFGHAVVPKGSPAQEGLKIRPAESLAVALDSALGAPSDVVPLRLVGSRA
jgi:DNA repair protein RadA/Sms